MLSGQAVTDSPIALSEKLQVKDDNPLRSPTPPQ